MFTKHRADTGFTLLEVLLVLGILAVLAAIVIPNLMGRQRKAMIRTTQIGILGLEGALRMYAAEHDGQYPEGTAEQVYARLLHPDDGGTNRAPSPYIEQLPTDAWDQMLYYEFPTSRHARVTKPAIWSAGPNTQNEDGNGDDINNWSDDFR